jgi:hypothetical protein
MAPDIHMVRHHNDRHASNRNLFGKRALPLSTLIYGIILS